MGGGEDAGEDVVVDGVGAKAPHVAALGDHAVDGLPLGLAVAPAAGVGRALGGARAIEAGRRGRPREALVQTCGALMVGHRRQH